MHTLIKKSGEEADFSIKLVVVPLWLEHAISTGTVPLEKVGDIEFLSGILSAEDVGFYLAAQITIGAVFGQEFVEGFPLQVPMSNIEKTAAVVSDLNIPYIDMKDPVKAKEIILGPEHVDVVGWPVDFRAETIGPNIIAIRMTEAAPQGIQSAVAKLYEGVVIQLNKFHSFQTVASTPMFRSFVRELDRSIHRTRQEM